MENGKYEITWIKGGTDNCYLITQRMLQLYPNVSIFPLLIIKRMMRSLTTMMPSLYSYGLVGFVVLKMSLKMLRNTRVKRPEKHVYINEGDALDNWIMPGVGHLYYDLEEQKKTADKIRSYGRRTLYYGHGKPTDKF